MGVMSRLHVAWLMRQEKKQREQRQQQDHQENKEPHREATPEEKAHLGIMEDMDTDPLGETDEEEDKDSRELALFLSRNIRRFKRENEK